MNENETITPAGAGESGRKTVDFAKSNDKLRARLKTVAEIAEAALTNQPHDEVPCWEHLVAALGRIETEMLIHTAEKPDGAGESGQTKARFDIEASKERMRELLGKVIEMAEKALAEPTVMGWRHYIKAVSDIRKALRPKPGTWVFENEWAWYGKEHEKLMPRMEVKDSPAEPQSRGEGEIENHQTTEPQNHQTEEKKAIGNFAGQGKVVSYAIDRDMTVTVTAKMIGDRVWEFKGIKNGDTLITGSVFGGKMQAMQYCKFIRNGIVSRSNLLKTKHRNAALRRAERAAESANVATSSGKEVAA